MGGSTELFDNHQGALVSRTQGYDLIADFKDSSTLRAGYDRDFDHLDEAWEVGPKILDEGRYRWDTLKASYNSNQSRRVAGSVGFETGGYYGGDKLTYRLGLNLQPLETLLVEANYNRNSIQFPLVERYVTNTISTRVSYSFSPELFVKTFIQYNSAREIASFNVLLWYIYRPGSDLYIVYNQGWDTNLPGPHPTQVSNKSFTVKFWYWLSR